MIATTVLKNSIKLQFPKSMVKVYSIHKNDDYYLDRNKIVSLVDGYIEINSDNADYYIVCAYDDSIFDSIDEYLINSDYDYVSEKLTWRLAGYLSMLTDKFSYRSSLDVLN